MGSRTELSIPLTQQPRSPRELGGWGPGTLNTCFIWAQWEGSFSPPCRNKAVSLASPFLVAMGPTMELIFTLTQEMR